ncbi:MAG TPA: hypothetical protein VLL25_11860 [Acidimicrobiales bacterium]|nr:hypothetical protein [Acidimicrobiales bacterium]
MGTILNNRDAEALLLDIRTASSAGGAPIDGPQGAFLRFPTSVVVDRPGRGQLVFPTHTDVEPGTLCHDDGTATLKATVDGFDVRGSFSWVVGRGDSAQRPARACYCFRRRGREVSPPAWANQLPTSSRLWAEPVAWLVRERCRLTRRGRHAEYWLLRLSERVFRNYCRGPVRRAIAVRPHVDEDDVVQRGLQAATRLLPVYASAARPPSSWVRMLQLDGKRDMHREITRLDWRADDLGSLSSIKPYDPALAVPDPQLDAVDEQRGVAVRSIASLLGRRPAVAALASLGDAGAIRELSDTLVATIQQPGETRRATRRRSQEEFRSTGRLLSCGVVSGGADRQQLAALDEALQTAVGLELP